MTGRGHAEENEMITRRSLLMAASLGALVPGTVRAQSEDQYFSGVVEDDGVQFRATNMALIPPELRRSSRTWPCATASASAGKASSGSDPPR
jgi:hypothetical protein